MSTRTAILEALDTVRGLVEALPEPPTAPPPSSPPPSAPPPPPPAIVDDPIGTWRTGPNASVRLAGVVWSISLGGKLLRNGADSIETSKTANVSGLGIITGPRLAHDGGARRWAINPGSADWSDVGAAAPGAPPASPPPMSPPPSSPPSTSGPYTAGNPPAEVRQWIRQVSAPAFVVPQDFVGMHLHRYPNLPQWERYAGRTATAKPTYGYGARRTWDYAEATAWCAIAGKSGNERNWSMLDELVATEQAAGRSIMLTVNGTPEALSSNPTGLGKYPGWPGCNYAPKDAAAFEQLRRYLSDVVARYGSRIAYIDTNNEPDPDNPIANSQNFWVGSRSPQHAEWHRMQRLAVPRGTGPKLIGPSQVFWDLEQGTVHPYALSVLTAKDTEGVRLIDHLDGYGWHYYFNPLADPIEYWRAITAIQATLNAAGASPTFPIFDTEHGTVDGTSADPQTFARRIQRDCAIAAGAGLSGIYLYSGDGPNLGNPSAGGPIGPAIDQVSHDLPGLELREAAILEDGRIWLRGLRENHLDELTY